MNYKAQLKGWAVDRVIELAKANDSKPSLEDVTKQAEALADYCYIADKDLDDHITYMFDLVRKYSDEAKIDAIIGTLEHIKEDLERQGMMKKAAEGVVQ